MATAPMAQDNSDLKSSLVSVLRQRSSYLKSQADSMTLPAVRRLLELDLGMKPLSLDAHKSLIKTLVDEVLNESEEKRGIMEKPTKRRKVNSRVVEDLQDGELDTGRSQQGNGNAKGVTDLAIPSQEKVTKVYGETSEEQGDRLDQSGKRDVVEVKDPGYSSDKLGMPDKEKPESEIDRQDMANKVKTSSSGSQNDNPDRLMTANEEKVAGERDLNVSPLNVAEVVVEQGTLNAGDMGDEIDRPSHESLGARNASENEVQLALVKRADELKSQAEFLTLTSVRRLLEEDLGLPSNGLDMHKQFIRKLVDELLKGECIDPADVKTARQNDAQGVKEERASVKVGIKSGGGKGRFNSEEDMESEEKPQRSEQVRGSESEEKKSKKRQKKPVESKKRTEVSKKIVDVKRPFSSTVERLRDIMKAAGIGVSPVIYKKAKLAPEHKRDEVLIKELENRLAQEGLSVDPSEKEIKKVKARLEKKRDLDGIESSNIVSEPRRSRAAANPWFTPRLSTTSVAENMGGGKSKYTEDSDDDVKPHVSEPLEDD